LLYKKAIELNPKSDHAYNGLGLCYESLKNKEEALKYYKLGYELNPLNCLILVNYSICLLSVGNYI